MLTPLVVTTAVRLPAVIGCAVKVTVSAVALADVTFPAAPSLKLTVLFAGVGSKPKPLMVMLGAVARRLAVLAVTTGTTVATWTAVPLLTPLTATDADSGVWKWRLKSNYPIVSGLTPTAGGVVFFGDVGGNFYALDAATGQKLWGQQLGGAVAGGVITYVANGAQKIAVAAGFTSPALPTKIVTAKVKVLGVEGQ